MATIEKKWIWPFELEEQIGAGAMGVVYRARFVKNNRKVALKLLPPEIAANATLAARFQREMEVLKDLRHPNIVYCFGGLCEGDQWFYAMELVEGGTVASLIREQGRLGWRQALDIGQQVCAALAHAHVNGVIHRDVKPGNLLLTKAGKIKLSDFGLAQMAAESKLTAAGKTVGSLHYMAPEQIQGKPPISNKTDLYALGCVLFEMLTGRPPFTGEVMGELLQRHISDTPPLVSSFALDCPPQLELLVSNLLEKDPDRRPADADAVAHRLEEIANEISIKSPRYDRNRPLPAAPPETVSAELQPARGVRPVNKWLASGLAVSLLVSIWLAFFAPGDTRAYLRSELLLVTALKNPDADIREFSARTLGEIGPGAAKTVPELLIATHDSEPRVSIAAIEAIGKIGPGDVAVVAPLTNLQKNDPKPEVRAAAEKSLMQLRENKGSSLSLLVAVVVVAVLLLAGVGYWGWKQVAA
jgi:eukaryotic-like serine/threonine-protein kinase